MINFAFSCVFGKMKQGWFPASGCVITPATVVERLSLPTELAWKLGYGIDRGYVCVKSISRLRVLHYWLLIYRLATLHYIVFITVASWWVFKSSAPRPSGCFRIKLVWAACISTRLAPCLPPLLFLPSVGSTEKRPEDLFWCLSIGRPELSLTVLCGLHCTDCVQICLRLSLNKVFLKMLKVLCIFKNLS